MAGVELSSCWSAAVPQLVEIVRTHHISTCKWQGNTCHASEFQCMCTVIDGTTELGWFCAWCRCDPLECYVLMLHGPRPVWGSKDEAKCSTHRTPKAAYKNITPASL